MLIKTEGISGLWAGARHTHISLGPLPHPLAALFLGPRLRHRGFAGRTVCHGLLPHLRADQADTTQLRHGRALPPTGTAQRKFTLCLCSLLCQDGEHVYNHLLSGALAGGCAATCTIPFDVVKTRLQTIATLPPEVDPPALVPRPPDQAWAGAGKVQEHIRHFQADTQGGGTSWAHARTRYEPLSLPLYSPS